MKKTAHIALFGALALLTTACTVTPPRVAVSGPTISIPDVFVIGDGAYHPHRDNVQFESHDRRDFGRSHHNQRSHGGYNAGYARGNEWGNQDWGSHR
ncbi:hypothetical protein DTO96_101503 [Ephemeroptericola cinctiostellae]|uniref:Lipoprotein n=1 Tax=Ephemeroptericola cinctiostellae TaxID=2268024 RepID=A0A345DBM9_9BURK|nr:hypothetical protein [Ephemeroptericola cinctiostellae]AXF85767.1 hypothetical protein DTO96_101503 [Ephemeroptericola cinctiostellae]